MEYISTETEKVDLNQIYSLSKKCFPHRREYFIAGIRYGNIVGYIFYEVNADGSVYLDKMGVEDSYRRLGVATGMIRYLEMKHPGLIYAHVRESNAASLALFQKLGYELHETVAGAYSNGENALVFKKYGTLQAEE